MILEKINTPIKKNIAIIGGGPSAFILSSFLIKKNPNLPITIYEKENFEMPFIKKYFSNDSATKNLNEKLMKKLNNKVSINLNHKINLEKKSHIKEFEKYSDIVLAVGGVEKRLEYIPSSLEFIEKSKKSQKNIKNKKFLIIGGGNVSMDLIRLLKENEAEKVYLINRSKWEESKFSNSEFLKTIKFIDFDFFTYNFDNKDILLKKENLNKKVQRKGELLSKHKNIKNIKTNDNRAFLHLLFNTKIKNFDEIQKNIKNPSKDVKTDSLNFSVNEIISAIGFQPKNCQPFISSFNNLIEKPNFHKIGVCNNSSSDIQKISLEAQILSEKICN